MVLKPRSRVHGRSRYLGFVASSLDGRISLFQATRPRWTSPQDWQWLQRSLARVDAVVVGRRTYQAAAARLRQRTTFVLTKRVQSMRRRGTVRFVNPATIDFRQLLQTYRTVAVLGGAQVYRWMIERNMLDEFFVTIEPWLFGHGTPMLIGGTRSTRLRLQSVRRLNRAGTLLLHYRVIRKR